jgi:hypothetical protein
VDGIIRAHSIADSNQTRYLLAYILAFNQVRGLSCILFGRGCVFLRCSLDCKTPSLFQFHTSGKGERILQNILDDASKTGNTPTSREIWEKVHHHIEVSIDHSMPRLSRPPPSADQHFEFPNELVGAVCCDALEKISKMYEPALEIQNLFTVVKAGLFACIYHKVYSLMHVFCGISDLQQKNRLPTHQLTYTNKICLYLPLPPALNVEAMPRHGAVFRSSSPR